MMGITESNLTHPLLWDNDDLLLQDVDALRDVDALQRGDANLTHHVLPSFYRPKRGYIVDKTVQTPHQTKCRLCVFLLGKFGSVRLGGGFLWFREVSEETALHSFFVAFFTSRQRLLQAGFQPPLCNIPISVLFFRHHPPLID